MTSLVYVTGVPGAGKSSVRRELRRRGHAAFCTDEDGIAAFFDRSECAVPANQVVDSSEWRSTHTWRIVPSRLDDIAVAADGGRVFICGSAAIEGEVWTRFAAVVALIIDEMTLQHRLDQRTDNNFGKSPDERAKAVGWLRGYAELPLLRCDRCRCHRFNRSSDCHDPGGHGRPLTADAPAAHEPR